MDESHGELEAMETEDIETEVISGNSVLTLITTEDGIPTSTEVTVLTTALGDVPIMTATLGTLAEVPLVTTHPTFVTSHPGVSTVYATSIAPPHHGQAVVVSDGRIAVNVMEANGVGQTIVVHADPSQITSALAQAQVQLSEDQVQNIVSVIHTESSTSSALKHESSVIIEEEQVHTTSVETEKLEELPPEEGMAGLENINETTTLVIEASMVEEEPVPDSNESDVLQSSQGDITEQEKTIEIIVPIFQSTDVSKEDSSRTEQSESVSEPPVPVIPKDVVCLICYQAFLNPKLKKNEETKEPPEGVNQDCSELQSESELANNSTPKSDPSADTKESNDEDDDVAPNCYGRSLGNFFELSRVSMSIVTRRSYRECEVPICRTCDTKLVKAEKILEEFKRLEKELYALRQEIKEEIVTSYNFFKEAENRALADSRKEVAGLKGILEVIDRIREDIINDGRPPRIPRPIGKGAGRKPKKEYQQPTETEQSSEGLPVAETLSSTEVGETGVPQNIKHAASLHSDALKEITKDEDSTAASKVSQNSADGSGENPTENEDEKLEKPAMRTSFGRLIKRPSYMVNELTEDELSDLGESSDDHYEEIEVKPEILPEGEPYLLDEEMDEEDPVWTPSRGLPISEKIGIPSSSSDDSDDVTEEDSDTEHPPKLKPKKESKDKKTRRSKPAARKQRKARRNPTTKQENINYEVKVIQLDGTELMTINTTGADDNIGLEPEITQKVMDSQAVIMVKNQLFGKRVHCPYCPRTFTDPIRKDVHVKKKHEGDTKPFECNVCQKRFGRQDHLRNHMSRHSKTPKNRTSTKSKHSGGEKNHSCEFCDQRFRNKSELSVHLRTHTGERPFKCEHCMEAFVSALKREFHIEQVHPEVPPLRCDFCTKGFFRQHRLRIHAVSHTGEKTNICEICGKCFSQAAMLRYHQTTHEELNLKQFKCQECSRVFANPQNLKSHVESQHQKMYRHRCDACDKGYTQMSHLRRHMRTHSGEQPFVCSYCPKKFTSGAALKIHVRIHTGERPYWCSQCEKGFRSKTKLARHLKTLIHSGENKDRIKKETTVTTEIETVDVNATSSATWTEIVGIITGI